MGEKERWADRWDHHRRERDVGREKGPPWEGERERGRQRDGTTMRREGKND